MKALLKSRAALSSLIITGALSGGVMAAGTGQGGRDVLHVPLSWCALQGSPAAAAPNITPEGSATADTSTDAVLWRRHERPTDNIFTPQADITFRSAINNAWGTLNFPIIADPDTAAAQQGDVRGENNTVLGAGSEFQTIIQNCDTAWANLGRAGIGITAVNVNLFHDANANYCSQDAAGNWTCTPIGWGGCARTMGSNTCSTPFSSRIMIVDNTYLYPTVADRTHPATTADPGGNLAYASTDPLDQLAGHELGHALGLDHRAATTALMTPTTSDNDGDGRIDSIALNATEIASLRASALNTPGLEIDPPGVIDPGRFVATTLVDQAEGKGPPAPNDLASLNVAIDKLSATAFVQLNLRGVFDKRAGQEGHYWMAFDTTEKKLVDPAQIKEIGAPFPDFAEADAFIEIRFSDNEIRGTVWTAVDGKLSPWKDKLRFERRQLVMHPYYTAPLVKEGKWVIKDERDEVPIYDIMTAILPAGGLGLAYGVTFEARAASLMKDEVVDVIETRNLSKSNRTLENPSFPHCFVTEAADPGGEAPVFVEGLLASRPIHALVGPQEVFKGTTDDAGNAEFKLPIPKNARRGLHLVTVGVDGTALTADCVVLVGGFKREGGIPGGTLDNLFALLEGHRQMMAEIAGRLEKSGGDVELNALYLDLVRRYADLSAHLEKELAK